MGKIHFPQPPVAQIFKRYIPLWKPKFHNHIHKSSVAVFILRRTAEAHTYCISPPSGIPINTLYKFVTSTVRAKFLTHLAHSEQQDRLKT
jgi:hypothetical protein